MYSLINFGIEVKLCNHHVDLEHFKHPGKLPWAPFQWISLKDNCSSDFFYFVDLPFLELNINEVILFALFCVCLASFVKSMSWVSFISCAEPYFIFFTSVSFHSVNNHSSGTIWTIFSLLQLLIKLLRSPYTKPLVDICTNFCYIYTQKWKLLG